MKEKSNQTAIDWYCNEMESLRVDSEINNMKGYDFLIRRAEIFQQAKQMEKEQIIEAFDWGSYSHYDDNPIYKTAEHYYNKTFKSEG
jgi:hypothetical protein